MAEEAIVKTVERYIQLLQNEGIIIEKAYLYGSYANESETEESDIDLMLISSQFNKTDDNLFGKIWSLTRKINSKIEPYIIGTGKFETDDISPIIQIVKKEGLEIAC